MANENEQSKAEVIDLMSMHEVTIDEIKNYVDEKPLTVLEKNNIMKCAEYYLLHLNPNQGILRRILQLNIEEDLNAISSRAEEISNFDFHQKMIKLFVSVRDFNVKYCCSAAFGEAFGILGLSISDCFDAENIPIYVVSGIYDDELKCNGFDIGCEIIKIDGEPVWEYAQKLGVLTYSTNDATKLKVGLRMITFREISEVPEPYPEETKVEYKTNDGEYGMELRWKYKMSKTKYAKQDTEKSFQLPRLNEVQISTVLSHYQKLSCLAKAKCSETFLKRIDVCEELNVLAEVHMCQSIKFIYIKFWNFSANFEEDSKFELSSSFMKIFYNMPQKDNGLIMDLRGALEAILLQWFSF